MFKVVIADDEPKVCQLIQRLVDWSSFGVEIVGTANNGIDAFNLICKHSPDVVITDIRMPGLDGLEMIKQVKESGIDPKFIIISGYRHFEYAHNALKYNVEDYLLKPIKKHELCNALEKICSTLSTQSIKVKEELYIKHQLMNNRSSLRKHFAAELLANPDSLSVKDLKYLNDEYQLTFQPGLYQAIHIKLDSQKNNELTSGKDKILTKITELAAKALSEKCFEIITSPTVSGIMCILNYDVRNAEEIKKAVKLLLEQIKEYIDFFHYFSVTIGIGLTHNSITDLSSTVQSAVNAVKCRIDVGVGRLIFAEGLCYSNILVTDILDSERERQLANISEILDIEGFKTWLAELFSLLKGNPSVNPCIIHEICHKATGIIVKNVRRLGGSIEQEAVLKSTVEACLDGAMNIDEIYNCMNEAGSRYLYNQLQEKRMQDNKPIRIAKQYISDHYMEQIRLDDVADLVHFNSAYFSTIFKKETGMNFSDYLTNYRIEVAKELLKTTNISVGDIAQRIGYLENKYFSKLFNKIVGIKPSEYRKLYS